jgi:hypothetical protein
MKVDYGIGVVPTTDLEVSLDIGHLGAATWVEDEKASLNELLRALREHLVPLPDRKEAVQVSGQGRRSPEQKPSVVGARRQT